MKKKILLLLVLSMIFAGVVSAASLWGSYKGNPIIKLQINGFDAQISDVPVISYNDRTMIPIYLLKQAGVEFTYDANKKTINILKPLDIDTIVSVFGSKGLNYISSASYMTDGKGFSQISYDINFDFTDESNGAKFNALLSTGTSTGAYQVRFFSNKSKYIYFIKTQNYKKFIAGQLNAEQFANTYELVNNDTYTGSGSTGASTSASAGSTNNATITYPLLYSNDGKKYLGKLSSNTYDTESVFNEYGDYGSKYSQSSIWNEYGNYGGDYANTSAFNKYATKPPIILQNGKVIGYLTTNSTLTNAISPYALLEWLKKNGY
ncbi:hypothetical protein ACFSR7_12405 [Cohnella sp. GCM10020058]|uniref:hypothetical protein n=1 Tax=Cohnella sp. GCM10020058 TaxID=3317330 RepID=UPI00363C705D